MWFIASGFICFSKASLPPRAPLINVVHCIRLHLLLQGFLFPVSHGELVKHVCKSLLLFLLLSFDFLLALGDFVLGSLVLWVQLESPLKVRLGSFTVIESKVRLSSAEPSLGDTLILFNCLITDSASP